MLCTMAVMVNDLQAANQMTVQWSHNLHAPRMSNAGIVIVSIGQFVTFCIYFTTTRAPWQPEAITFSQLYYCNMATSKALRSQNFDLSHKGVRISQY